MERIGGGVEGTGGSGSNRWEVEAVGRMKCCNIMTKAPMKYTWGHATFLIHHFRDVLISCKVHKNTFHTG